MKNTSGNRYNDEQILPLSQPILSLFMQLPNEGRGANELVFKSTGGNLLSNWDRETKRIHRLSSTSNWHRHDLREWAATAMARLGVTIDVYERILNHSLSTGSAVRRHYDRYSRLDEQREALEQLGEHLTTLDKN